MKDPESQENSPFIGTTTEELSVTEQKIDQMNKNALNRLNFLDKPRGLPFTNTKFSLRGLFDAPRMALQTRIGEKPPVLETNTLKIPFVQEPLKTLEYKPSREGGETISKLMNPMNIARLGANLLLRTASFVAPKNYNSIGSSIGSIPLLKAISYRGRQTAGAVLTMAAHAGNVITKTGALFHYARKIHLIKKGIEEAKKTGTSNTLATQEYLDSTRKERNATLKNWGIATVATGGLVGGTLLTAGVAPVVAAAHTVAAGSHGLITTNTIEATGAVKKTILMAKEEGEHLIDLQQSDSLIKHLNELEKTIKSPTTTTEDRKMAFAQQKRMMELHSQENPTFISHETKLKLGLTSETKDEMKERVSKETEKEIARYNSMKETLLEHKDITHDAINALSPVKRKELLEARTFAGKSGSR